MIPHPAAPIAGYVAEGDRLFRFDQAADGDREVISALCPDLSGIAAANWRAHWGSAPSAVLYLPQPRQNGAITVETVLTSRGSPEPAGAIGRVCRAFSRIRGTLREVDKYALVEKLRRTDVPMRFYRSEADIPGCRVRLTGESPNGGR